MDCVVGSGPSGVSAAVALMQRGRRVLMVDGGVGLEPERAQTAADIGRLQPAEWRREHREWLMAAPGVRNGIPLKLRFGSDYPYRDAEEHIGISAPGVGLKASLASGGLSNVWGAAMLPYTDGDLASWPVNRQNLGPHYREVLKLTGLSAASDDLDELFPLFTDAPGELNLSRQARAVLDRLDRNRGRLKRSGISFGRARLAVSAPAQAPAQPGCAYCGMCMYGCPYGQVYSSERTLNDLRRDERFTHWRDIVVVRVEERDGRPILHGYHRLTRDAISIDAERVYLAGGVIPTTAILLRSRNAHGATIAMKDSQYFILPAILPRGVPNVREERLHTLSQLFIEVLDEKISRHLTHLQVYSFNSHIAEMLRRALGPLANRLDAVARSVEGRLMVIMGYLHSNESSEIAVTLNGEPGNDALRLTPVVNPEAGRVAKRIARKLLMNATRLGLVALPALLKLGEPGRGFHAGGTFPMRAAPREFESDIWGRPSGWSRVHAVDATILPTIPATTITFTVMANAHRIASEFETGSA